MSSGPPPPPKRKNHKPVATYSTGSSIPVPVGSGINVARAISENSQYNSSHHHVREQSNQVGREGAPARRGNEKQAAPRKPKNRICILEDSPDAVIGHGVEIHGDFEYDRLVRIDGKFQGTLFSHNRGDIVVGPNGCIIGDVIVARKMIIEGGHVVGKIVVDELLLLGNTIIKGDVTCKLIEIDGPHVTITGRANIHALAPELVDEYDNIITEIPKKPKKTKKDIYPAPKSPSKHNQQQQSRQYQQVIEADVREEPEVHAQHSPPRQQSSDSLNSQVGSNVNAKATSSQTNASSRPSRNKKSDVAPEEAAALEAALAERNAAKERHKQLKQAKNGVPTEPVEAPKILAPTKPNPPKESRPDQAAPSTKSVIAQKTAVDMVAGAIESALTPREEPQTAYVPTPAPASPSPVPSKSPEKSPAKLLPPSEAQRKQQLEVDQKAAAAAAAAAVVVEAPAAAADADTKVEPEVALPELADVERDKAAVSLQRVARGRLTRTRTQSREVDKKPAATAQAEAETKESENTTVTEEDTEAERRRKAAVEVQKMARGKIIRKNTTNNRSGKGKNSPRKDASVEVNDGSVTVVEDGGGGEATTTAGPTKVSIEATPSPFGPGYTESLAIES